MKRFTQLFCELDQTTRTNEKVAALERYFSEESSADAAWALHFLCGRTIPRVVTTKNLWQWAAAESALPEWLMEECHQAVGDLAETLALLLPNPGAGSQWSLSDLVNQRLLPLAKLPDRARHKLLLETWRDLNPTERLVWNKLITGNFRIGVSRTLVVRALANSARLDPAVMAHRIMGKWQPSPEDFQRLLAPVEEGGAIARPYPFFLASPLETLLRRGESLDALGEISQWQFEWKWDGIRAQLIRRGGETIIWSRGDEMVTETFPEITEAAAGLPDGAVLDGEILAWSGEHPLPFHALQRRLGRKMVDAKTRKKFPVAFVAYDLLEWRCADFRNKPLSERRRQLEQIIAAAPLPKTAFTRDADMLPGFDAPAAPPAKVLRISPLVAASSWSELSKWQDEARDRGVEGLMLKQMDSVYGVGRQRGSWWKWKVDPFTVDAVLVAAQRGHGRRASLYTDYTFAVWHNGELTPVAKAYSGLTDEEILEVDTLVRNSITEKFGPVRAVEPTQVFEIAFEGIQKSSRHKSGVAVRFPRINRWRRDKKPKEADMLDFLLTLAESVNAKARHHAGPSVS